MQDFDLNESINSEQGELTMTVSPVCMVEGQKKAFVSFADGKRTAEGEIPACIINKSVGFTEEEKLQLETYLRVNLSMIKKMAANIDVLAAMMKSK